MAKELIHNTICADCGDSFNAPDSRYKACDFCEETRAAKTQPAMRALLAHRAERDRETFEAYYEV